MPEDARPTLRHRYPRGQYLWLTRLYWTGGASSQRLCTLARTRSNSNRVLGTERRNALRRIAKLLQDRIRVLAERRHPIVARLAFLPRSGRHERGHRTDRCRDFAPAVACTQLRMP